MKGVRRIGGPIPDLRKRLGRSTAMAGEEPMTVVERRVVGMIEDGQDHGLPEGTLVLNLREVTRELDLGRQLIIRDGAGRPVIKVIAPGKDD